MSPDRRLLKVCVVSPGKNPATLTYNLDEQLVYATAILPKKQHKEEEKSKGGLLLPRGLGVQTLP